MSGPDPNGKVLILFILLFLIWSCAYGVLWAPEIKLPRVKTVLIVFAPLALFLTLLVPVFSTDIFEYLIRGRMPVIYGVNPFAHVPNEFPQDIFFSHVFWKDWISDYGPVSALIQCVPPLVFPDSFLGSIFMHKVMGLFFYAWMVKVFYGICVRFKMDYPSKTAMLLALNPILVLYVAAEGHNGILMMAFMMYSISCSLNGRWTRCFIAWSFAFMVKYSVVLFLPFILVMMIGIESRDRFWGWVRPALKAGGSSLLTLSLFYWLFKVDFLNQLAYLKTFAGAVVPGSFLHMIYRLVNRAGFNADLKQVAGYCSVLAVIAVIALLWRLWLARKNPHNALLQGLFLVVIVFCLQIGQPFPWYLIWGLPWLMLARLPRHTVLITAYTCIGTLGSVIQFGPLVIFAAASYGYCLIRRRIFSPQTRMDSA